MSRPRRHTHTQPHRKTGLCSRLAAHTPPLSQVAFADRILLNKTDLVSEEDLLRVEKRLKSINSQESTRRESTRRESTRRERGRGTHAPRPAVFREPHPHLPARAEAATHPAAPQAPVQRCTKAEVSPDWVLDIGAFDLKRVIEMDPEFLNTDGEMQPRDAAPRCSLRASCAAHVASKHHLGGARGELVRPRPQASTSTTRL